MSNDERTQNSPASNRLRKIKERRAANRRIEWTPARLRLVALMVLLFAYGWIWLGPAILVFLGFREVAGWAILWFIPTSIGVTISGIATICLPNRYTLSLFGLTLIPHFAVGFGLFPK